MLQLPADAYTEGVGRIAEGMFLDMAAGAGNSTVGAENRIVKQTPAQLHTVHRHGISFVDGHFRELWDHREWIWTVFELAKSKAQEKTEDTKKEFWNRKASSLSHKGV